MVATEDEITKVKLILTIESFVYVHIKNTETTKDMLKLKQICNDSGLSRRITLLRSLFDLHYGNQTQIVRHGIGCHMLAGLPDKYLPMIMAIEHSGIAITMLLTQYCLAE